MQDILKTDEQGMLDQGFTGARVSLTDADGDLLLSTDAAFLNQNIKELAAIRTMITGQSGSGIEKYAPDSEFANGYAHLQGAMGYPGMNWGVMVDMPASSLDAMTGMEAIRNKLILTWIGSVAVIGVLGYWLARTMSKLLQEITEAAQKLSVGDTDIHLSHEGNDEIGKMSESFRKLQAYLAEATEASRRVAAGDMNIEIHPRS